MSDTYAQTFNFNLMSFCRCTFWAALENGNNLLNILTEVSHSVLSHGHATQLGWQSSVQASSKIKEDIYIYNGVWIMYSILL